MAVPTPVHLSSLDPGYSAGMLSVYPAAPDSKTTLYQATNNSQTVLTQSLTYNGRVLSVNDTSAFPPNGLLRVGPPPGQAGSAELVYYSTIAGNSFQGLIRGFAGSRQNQWPISSWVTNSVMADHHNSVKDAILNIEHTLGLQGSSSSGSLNGMLTAAEARFLAPSPLFRAFPVKGTPPLRVRFQNFTTGSAIRFLWDFGDGTTSVEKSPIHTFQTEGLYTIQLSVITGTGAHGIATKANYINVSFSNEQPFFYVQPVSGNSIDKAAALTAMGHPTAPTTFLFVDQTDGDIIQRYWVFDDGNNASVDDPNQHTITYTYQSAGTYSPSLLTLLSNQNLQRIFLQDTITVF